MPRIFDCSIFFKMCDIRCAHCGLISQWYLVDNLVGLEQLGSDQLSNQIID